MARPTFGTWTGVLAYALELISAVPATHNVESVMFGTFADGEGHYVEIRVGQVLGNTIGAYSPHMPANVHQRRIEQVVEAWERARTPKEVGIDDD